MSRWLRSETGRLCVLYVLVVAVTTGISGALGPTAAVIDSFFGIGLVIVIRARLHDLWDRSPFERMAGLILVGSLGSLVVNAAHPKVALASGVAFLAANGAAAVVYEFEHDRPWYARLTVATVVFAAVDSLVFPAIAFGAFDWTITVAQFAAKVLGAAAWAYLLRAGFVAYDRTVGVRG